MLNKAKPKRLKCKGYNLRSRILNLDTKYSGVGKALGNGIPVLSIFALLGIVGYTLGVQHLFSDIDRNEVAYAAEGTDTSASLIVDDGVINDKINAAYNNFAYASHKVTVEASNIKSYTLTLTRNKALTGPSTVTDAAGKTPAQMTGTSSYFGYAWINDGADPTTATYSTLNATQNLTNNPAINSTTHSVSGSKQLVFGAKFGDSATSGTYSAKATLSMVATPRVVTNYVVTVNCNGGTGCTSALNTSSDEASYTYTISSTVPTRSGYKFLGYNTTNSATADTNYGLGKSFTLTAAAPTKTLYAVWEQDVKYTYTITFSANQIYYTGGLPSSISCTSTTTSCSTTLPNNIPTAICGYVFRGWDTNSKATSPTYQAGSQITIAKDTPLYGIWVLASRASEVCEEV